MNHIQGNCMLQVRAFAWEFWAHGWRGQLLALAGVVAVAGLIYGAFLSVSELSFRGTEVGTAMHFGFYWVTLVFLGSPILSAWGVPRLRYTLPTSSLVIVACPMVCSMVSMFVLYALAALTMNMLFDAGWPIWGPGLVAALSVAWLQAFLWSTSNSQGLQLVSGIASFGVLLFGVLQVAEPGAPATSWFHEGIDASHALLFALVSVICIGVGTVGFANLRRGSGMDFGRIVDWASRLFPKTARLAPFASPTSAQFWLEWTERGHIMPGGTVVVGIAMLLIACFIPAYKADGFLGGISMMLLISALVSGIFLGGRSANGQFGNFNGSRPLPDGQIANAVLTSATAGLLWSALIWAAFVVAAWFILGERTGLLSIQGMIEQLGSIRPLGFVTLGIRLLGIVTLALGAIWGAVGLMTSLFLAGKKVGIVVQCTLFGVLIVGNILQRHLFPREILDTYLHLVPFALVALTLACIAAGFVASWRLHLISRCTLFLAASIGVAMLTAAYYSGVPIGKTTFLPLFWGCCAIPFPLAAAPLAVWWNRHR